MGICARLVDLRLLLPSTPVLEYRLGSFAGKAAPCQFVSAQYSCEAYAGKEGQHGRMRG